MSFARAGAVTLAALLALASTGCTRRQLVPGVVAGTGAALLASGAIYRATLETDAPFGETDGQIATTTVLIFGGLGILVTGVILSITSAHCDDNSDCWASDACELRSHTCISGAAARSLRRSGEADESPPEPAAEPSGARPAAGPERAPYPH